MCLQDNPNHESAIRKREADNPDKIWDGWDLQSDRQEGEERWVSPTPPTDADWWGWSGWDKHRRRVVTATAEEVQPTVGADVWHDLSQRGLPSWLPEFPLCVWLIFVSQSVAFTAKKVHTQ